MRRLVGSASFLVATLFVVVLVWAGCAEEPVSDPSVASESGSASDSDETGDLVELTLPVADEADRGGQVFSADWGSEVGEVGLRRTGSGDRGPSKLAVSPKGRFFAVYDGVNERANLYLKSRTKVPVPLSEAPVDIALDDSGNLYALFEDRRSVLKVYSRHGELIDEARAPEDLRPTNLSWVDRILYGAGESGYFPMAADGRAVTPEEQEDSLTARYPLGDGKTASLERREGGSYDLDIWRGGEAQQTIRLVPPEGESLEEVALTEPAWGRLPVVRYSHGQSADNNELRTLLALDPATLTTYTATVELGKSGGGDMPIAGNNVFALGTDESGMRVHVWPMDAQPGRASVSDLASLVDFPVYWAGPEYQGAEASVALPSPGKILVEYGGPRKSLDDVRFQISQLNAADVAETERIRDRLEAGNTVTPVGPGDAWTLYEGGPTGPQLELERDGTLIYVTSVGPGGTEQLLDLAERLRVVR